MHASALLQRAVIGSVLHGLAHYTAMFLCHVIFVHKLIIIWISVQGAPIKVALQSIADNTSIV